ncbi:MAG: hemerythrin domain-containing protein [Rhodocyclales bacterium]|nr:hemerythrin domain-containing protein [Rhodocyclales bacterium]
MPTTPAALRIIKDEHQAIAAVLYSLRYLVRKAADGQLELDPRLLHAMLDYIVEFPERLHHPKENRYLFKALRLRHPQAGAILDELVEEHVRGEVLIEELKRALLALETAGPPGLTEFSGVVEKYSDFHWRHMRKEEDIVMPLAEKWLQPQDWEQIGAAFRENDNPLFGIRPQEQFEELLKRILRLAPPPLGDAAR